MFKALTATATLALLAGAPAPETTRVVAQAGVKNAYPRWSKDGRRILFQSNRGGRWHLFTIDREGRNEVQLTRGESNDNFPDWSPDNTRIAFVSDRGGSEDIHVMRTDGTDVRVVAKHPAREIHPYWTPDGKAILFNSDRDGGHLQIYEVQADGSGAKRLVTSGDEDTCARVSPNGDRMVYLANLMKEGRDDILMRKRDGSGVVNVTNDAPADGWPTWTPDGSRLVFASQREGAFALYSARPDGSDARRLSSPPAGWFDGRPSISPDGQWIAFNREKGETIEIHVMPMPGA